MTIVDQAEIFEFPCEYQFKAFCAKEAITSFRESIKQAVNTVVMCPDDAIKERQSAKANYTCVSALVIVESRTQLEAINTEIRKIDTLMFML